MAYFVRSELETKISRKAIDGALSEGGPDTDGSKWAALVAGVSRQIDGRLEGRYTVPLADPLPAIVREAAVILAAEAIYMLRGFAGDQNPWVKQADDMRARFDKIGRGDLPLTNEAQPVQSSGSVIAEPSRLHADDQFVHLLV